MRSLFVIGLFCTISTSVYAQDQVKDLTFEEAIKASKPIVDLRLRYEGADFDNIDETADALTIRARVGVETGKFLGTTALIEFDHTEALVEDFNSVLNGRSQFPVIADPEVTELNRLQLRNTSIEDTSVTLGRQRIIFDNARFIGNVGWRQDEQTYDALHVSNNSIENLTLNVAYVDQVNRIFGDDEPQSKFESDSWLLNAGYKIPNDIGAKITLGGYAYILDLSAAALSSKTFGVFVDIGYGGFKGRVEYATQSDHADSPLDYSEDYLAASIGYSKSGFNASLGYEELGGDGTGSFSTPLATGHKFNGFADVFLATPADGLEDLYGKIGYKTGSVGVLPFINMFAVYHDFNAASGGADYGTEIDAVVATKIGKTGVLLKYANYNADAFATDIERYSIQFDYKF